MLCCSSAAKLQETRASLVRGLFLKLERSTVEARRQSLDLRPNKTPCLGLSGRGGWDTTNPSPAILWLEPTIAHKGLQHTILSSQASVLQ